MRAILSLFMKLHLRARLIIGLSLVVIIPGLAATLIGVHLLADSVIDQAQNKVRLDLNTAREIYYGHVREIRTILEYSALRPSIWESMLLKDKTLLSTRMMELYEKSALDILNITDDSLRVIFRCSNPQFAGDSQIGNPIVAGAFETGFPVGSTFIMPRINLMQESANLENQALIDIIPTPKAEPIDETESTSGMMIMAAVPLFDESGRRLGIIYGGDLLNRDYRIVDKIKDIVFRGEKYEGIDIGTSTIFQEDVRISTNVLTEQGNRAIGTRVSAEVRNQVLGGGKRWIDRAFVVNNWYITAYEPIKDVQGQVVGVLYVGILEKPYNDLKRNIIIIFLSIAGISIALAIVISYFLSRSILSPIAQLKAGAQRLARGDLGYRIPIQSDDEVGMLCEAFNSMAESLLDHDRKLKESTQRQLTQSEKLASIGRLAAGVAHEINNPLTGVLTFSSLLLEEKDLPAKAKDDLQIIVNETTRCRGIVRNLLDFARETKPEIIKVDINKLIRSTLDLIRKQSLFQNIDIKEQYQPSLPEISADLNQIKQVVMNLVLNGAEAMPEGGKLFITTNHSNDNQYITITVKDSGMGITEENLKFIFDPFFTTKEQGKGTGLGLAVSYGIIQRHGGTITVTSQVDRGTTFEINLPLNGEE
ncbi:cache domain-containing protein [candidate division KSB1 bacterium]